MPDWLKRKLTSRKFWAAMIVTIWWLIEGSLSGTWGALGWQIVAVVLGYIAGEGIRDALLAYWRGTNGKDT